MRRGRERLLRAVLMLVAGLLMAAAGPQAALSPHEELLGSQIGFDKDVLGLAKEESNGPLHRLSGYDESGYQIMVNGLVVSVPQNRAEQVLFALRGKLADRRYMAFIIEVNDGIKTDKIGIIKGTDQYDILRIMRTNGDPADISHEDVIEKLKEWEKCCPFEIIGAENEWVELEFKKLPGDIQAFAEEVYDFSPDTVDEGTGTVPELAKELKATKRLLLWWE